MAKTRKASLHMSVLQASVCDLSATLATVIAFTSNQDVSNAIMIPCHGESIRLPSNLARTQNHAKLLVVESLLPVA